MREALTAKTNRLEYVHSMLVQLRRMAADEDHEMLVYLIEMASTEANDILRGARPSSIRRNQRDSAA
ncbi:hypothetical protein [Aliihoeflea sp. 2WW]|jgi:hypothetical protein|uniref:hypothetical protein n=1 Tax=Aliihoeflea sp. 2WW TaxID=1381123 RepID=UPI00046382E3|nr:hypothetical protein [Aliihoeflea sp. 2WW]